METLDAVLEYVELLDQEKQLKAKIDKARAVAMESMKTTGLTQIKTKLFTASLAQRVTTKVDEVQFSGAMGDEAELFYTRVFDQKLAAAKAEDIMKMGDGEMPDWVTRQTTEYISIREAK